jgi:uncharacterized repeat protein (TIGR03803 family)
LLEAPDGFLYGTTQRGGTNQMGIIYMIRKDGSGYTILYTFPGQPTDGLFPGAGLVRGSDSVFYGMTPKGGSGSLGISNGLVYKLWPPETPDMLSSIPSLMECRSRSQAWRQTSIDYSARPT